MAIAGFLFCFVFARWYCPVKSQVSAATLSGPSPPGRHLEASPVLIRVGQGMMDWPPPEMAAASAG